MGKVKGRITNVGDLFLEGELDESSPTVNNGLEYNFPFNYSNKGFKFNNILDYSTWQVGTTGTQGMFGRNGNENENHIVMDKNPFGFFCPIWEARPDSTSGADGGWNTGRFPIDNTKRYRFSVWVNRKVIATDGRFYFGCHGYGTTDGVINVNNGTNYTNPYFWYSSDPPTQSQLPENEWVLIVAFIHPHDYTGGNHADSGIYRLDGNKYHSIHQDFKWRLESVKANHRTYLYYSTDTAPRQQWCYPRVDVIDGSEPTIKDLLTMEGNVQNLLSNTGTTHSHDGIAVEEATSNYLENGNFKDGKGIPSESGSNPTNEIIKFPNPNNESIHVLRQTGSSAEYEVHFKSGTSMQTNKTYTLSCWVAYSYDFDGNDQIFHSRIYYSDGTNTAFNGKGILLDEMYIGGLKWEKRSLTFSTDATKTVTGFNWYFGYPTSNTKGYRYATELQIENKDFATSFVDGSRSAGVLDIGTQIGTGDFTVVFKANNVINGKIRQDKTWLALSNSGESSYVNIFNGYGYDFYIGDNYNRTHYKKADMNSYNMGDDLIFIVSRNGSTISVDIYKNNSLHYSTSQSDSTYFTFPVDKIRIGRGVGNQSSSYRLSNALNADVSLYNRVLSDSEIKKIVSNKMSITKEGNMISDAKERPNYLPKDSYYFPLGYNANDETDIVTPNVESNLTYDDGSVWVGLSTDNLYPNITSFNVSDASGTLSDVYYGKIDGQDTYKITKSVGTPSTHTSFRYCFDPGRGVTATMSFKVKIISGDISSIGKHWGGGTSASITKIPLGDNWYQCEYTGTTPSGSSLCSGIGVVGNDSCEFLATKPQLEFRPFRTPFTEPSINRGKSDLEFNFHRDIGLDWNADWSLIYWKKPTGTHSDVMTGYSIESVGCNSNSVGGGYRWFGKDSSYDKYQFKGSGHFANTPSHFFDTWQMISLVKSGSSVTYKVWDKSNYPSATQSWGTIASNYFVTQYGYDFKMGGWDDINVCNTYFKDLIVAKRAFTTSELEAIYKTGMSAKDGITVQNQIRENNL